eukprot:2494205-Amphidinium_carterae.1
METVLAMGTSIFPWVSKLPAKTEQLLVGRMSTSDVTARCCAHRCFCSDRDHKLDQDWQVTINTHQT